MTAAAAGPAAATAAASSVIAVVPDVSGIDRHFEYLVPSELAPIAPGTLVRVPLGPRRVRAWVLGEGRRAPTSPELRPVAEVVSLGPEPAVVDLARYGAARYAGWLRPFLVAASPPRRVRELPLAAATRAPEGLAPGDELAAALEVALAVPLSCVRLPPRGSRLELVAGVLSRLEVGSDLLVLVAEHRDAAVLGGRLARLGVAVARYPEEWPAAAAGGRVVVGTRNAVLASTGRLGAIVVLDAHEESYVSARAPTWRATELAAERARRAGVPCVFVSACPPLELTFGARLVTVSPARERAGWPPLEVLDRRGDDPRAGLYAPPLAEIIRGARRAEPSLPVVCVLNRTGRARLLACGACGEIVTCEHCGAALIEARAPEPGAARVLSCRSCLAERPALCASCGSRALRLLRIGVARATEELAALTGLAVSEVSGTSPDPAPGAGLVVGTEAALHRVREASLVVFLDFDQQLLGPRFRASEQALAMLARAARLVGQRARGRIVVQTRLVASAVLDAAAHGDPGRLAEPEAARRRQLRLPPYAALALIAGEGAARLAAELGSRGLEVSDEGASRFLVRAPDHEALLLALGAEAGELGSGELGSGELGSGELGSGEVGSGRVGLGRVGSGRTGSVRVAIDPVEA